MPACPGKRNAGRKKGLLSGFKIQESMTRPWGEMGRKTALQICRLCRITRFQQNSYQFAISVFYHKGLICVVNLRIARFQDASNPHPMRTGQEVLRLGSALSHMHHSTSNIPNTRPNTEGCWELTSQIIEERMKTLRSEEEEE